jgi:hypothetical protein
MTEPVNNQWLDEILQVLHEDLGYIEADAYYDSDRQRLYDNRMQEAKLAILSKLESIEQEAYKRGFIEGSLSKLPVLQVNSKSHNYSEGKG